MSLTIHSDILEIREMVHEVAVARDAPGQTFEPTEPRLAFIQLASRDGFSGMRMEPTTIHARSGIRRPEGYTRHELLLGYIAVQCRGPKALRAAARG